ncbi:MAG: hypothetical protein FJ098_04820, partial [Deltaproteobacteria bacterium]|nr:hypothetical protein [Deltaproteobacteria bacterium]
MSMILRRAILLTLLTHALPGLAAAQGVPPGLRVDRSLLPLPGAAEENIRLLEATLAGSSDPALRALLGIQHLGNRDAAAATRLCTEAMTSALTLEAPYCLALIHYYAGELEAVAAPLEQARTRAPGHPATYLLEAYAAAARGDGGAVVAALEAGQRATPDEETALWEWELLRLLDRIGDHAGAIQAAGKLIQLTPDDPGVYHAAALLEQRQGRLREAIRMELICLSKAPWHEAAARGLLTLLERDERLDEALTWADRLRISPHLTPLRDELDTTRARLAARLAETRIRALESEARVVLTEDSLRDADPAVAVPLLLGAARVLLELDLPVDRPLHLLTWGERFSPMNPEILLSLGEALLRAGRPEEAEEVAAQAGISGGDRADRRLLLARVAAVRSDTEGCLRETGAGLLLRGQDTSLLRLRASCLFAERRSEEALEALRALLRAAPGDREAQGVLVDWYRSREPSEALGILTAMHGQDPWDFRITAKAAALARDRKDADAELRWLLELARTLPPHQAARQEEALERIREILAGNRRLRQLHGGSLEGLCAGGLSGACALTELLSEPGAGRTPGTPGSSGRSAPAPRNGTAAGSAAGERLIGELERLGPDGADFLVLGLEADGFAALPVRQRIFLFLLSRAAIAGDELLYIQNHRLALPLKRLLETLWAGRGKLSLRTAAAVHDYLKYLWVNHGPYDHRSGVKFVPRFLTPRMLRAAMERLARDGEVFAFLPGQDLEERFAGIRDAIFNPTVEPRLTVTEPGQDVVAESAVNLYAPGITGAMIEALPEAWRNRLNVQYELAPSGQAAVPRTMDVTWREGARIERIIHFLRKAIPFADEGPQRASLEHLVEFYETGAEDLFNLHSVAWLRSDSATDYLNGFIEQLKDPRGVIGQFEGMAGFVSDSGMVGRLADAAAYFETRVPWPEEFRRTEVPRPVSNVIDIVCGTGDMGPVPWAGYNLPNDAELRETHGSKN